MPEEENITQHYRQIDGLRAWAVLAVILEHTLTNASLIKALGPGFLGVRLFFVISGFLITGILLNAREKSSARGLILKNFYIRRFLRIFPAYYALLFILLIMGLEPLVQTWHWHFSYLSNFYFAWRGEWLDPLSHLWSLAVEEQFYLFWPALILFCPKRYLPHLLLASILTAPAFRLVVASLSQNGITAKSLTPACMDALGLGAWLAYVQLRIGTYWRWLAIAGGLFLVTVSLKIWDLAWPLRVALLDFSAVLLFALVVAAAAQSQFGKWGKILLENHFLLYLGKISYGIYLYHLLIPFFFQSLTGQPLMDKGWALFLTVTVLSTLMASLSWFLMELHINQLKKYFNYPSRNQGKEKTLRALS